MGNSAPAGAQPGVTAASMDSHATTDTQATTVVRMEFVDSPAQVCGVLGCGTPVVRRDTSDAAGAGGGGGATGNGETCSGAGTGAGAGAGGGTAAGVSPAAPASCAVVVLGQKLLPDGQPSLVLRNRIDLTVQLHTELGGVPIITTGADVAGSGESEASVMRRLLASTGKVPKSAIHMDESARNTLENATGALPIVKGLGVDTIVLVTSDFHVPRAALLFEGALRHLGTSLRVVCVGSSSGHPRKPSRSPRPWKRADFGGDISLWHLGERCEHEQLLLRHTMPRWFDSYGYSQPPPEVWERAARQLQALAASVANEGAVTEKTVA